MIHMAWLDATFCARLTLTLGHFLWQGLVIAMLTMLAGRLFRGASATVRYGMFVVALLLMTMCPPVTFCLLHPVRPISSIGPQEPVVAVADAEPGLQTVGPIAPKRTNQADFFPLLSTDSTPSADRVKQDETVLASEPDTADDEKPTPAAASVVPAVDRAETPTRFDWRPYSSLATVVYLVGALAMLCRLAIGLYGADRLRRRSQPVEDAELLATVARRAESLGLRFRPAVAYCRQIAGPTVIGVLRPTILLPLSVASGLNHEQLEAILVHELAHIRRHDYLVNLIQRLVEALLFFHPAVWFVSRRIRVERERCCDDVVLATGTEPLSYATSLLRAAELGQASRARAPSDPMVAVGATGRPSDLVDRIRRLIDRRTLEPVRLKHPWVSLLCIVAIFAIGSLLVFHLNVQAQSARDTSEKPAVNGTDVPVSTDRADHPSPAGNEAGSADPTIQRLLAQLRDEDAFVREIAARALSEIRDEALVDPLIKALDDEQMAVRRAAAHGLGNLGDARAVEPLVKTLEKAKEKFEIETVVWALGEIGDPRSIDPIVEALSPEEPSVSFHSMRSIVNFRDVRIADLLLKKMQYDNGGLNFNIVSMLVQMEEHRLVEPLLDHLENGPSRKRWRAANALGRLGDPRAVEPLIAALNDQSESTREAAAGALGELGDPRAVEPMIEFLANEKEDDVIESAAEAVALLGDERALEALNLLTDHDDGRVREAVAKAIADIQLGANCALRTSGEEQGLKISEEALNDGGEAAARAAARVLRRIAGKRATEALVRSVKDPRVPVRSEVIGALAWIESDRAADGLAQALVDEDANNRWDAARMLAIRKDRRAVEPLVAFTQSGTYIQKRYAAEYLGALGDPRGIEPLCAMLNDSERRVRREAAEALRRIADQRALDSLLGAFDNEKDESVRAAIVDALGRIHHPRAIQVLEQALADKQRRIVWRAAHSLARLGWKPSSDTQRIRFMIASGRTAEADDLIPKAEPAADNNRLAGKFELDKPILAPLTVGTPEWPDVLMIRSVELSHQTSQTRAIVQLNKYSWPSSTWRVLIQLKDDAGKVMATAEKTIKTAGIIISQRMLESQQPHELSFGRVNDLDRVRRFELSVEQVSDDRQPQSPVKITKSAEAPLALAQDIPISLEAQSPFESRIVWTENIRFEPGSTDDKKREVKARLKLKWASLMRADWRVWLLLLDEEGKMVTRTGARFSTQQVFEGQAPVVDENLEMPLTVWKGYREPARFRLGLELTKDHSAAARAERSIPQGAMQLSHVDDTAEGKRSIAASGHAARFERTEDATFVEAVQIFASRYGYSKPPDEDFHVYLLNEKHQVLADLRYPYSMIERGDESWYTLRTPSVEVPKRFLVALSFNPHKTKGIYLGYDKNVKQSHSLVGLPEGGYEPVKDTYDWMVRLQLSHEPSGKKGIMRLADWKPPVHVDPFEGCLEAKYDTGQSEGIQSYGGSGPAIRFKLAEVLPKDVSIDNLELKGFRLYAGRYGSGYDTEQTMLQVAALGHENKTLWKGTFPYSLFTYKAKWVDVVLPEPLALRRSDLNEGELTVAMDPEAHQYKGIYFHYNKNPDSSHSLAGTVAKGFRQVPDREWMIRAFFSVRDQ